MGRFNNPMHDDVYHSGSAKRDTVNGVVGLDAGGNILAKGGGLYLALDVSGNINITDRTNSDQALYLHRYGVHDFSGRIFSGGAESIIQLANMKDVASGIAGLDASSKQVPAQHFVGVPATAGAAGVAGQMAYASGYLYICVATNTWEKATIATW